MKFTVFPIDDSAGVILAHTFRSGAVTLKKGHVITATDIAALKAAGVDQVMGARLADDDVSEDAAAAQIAMRIAGVNVHLSDARTGRCNIEATHDGVVLLDEASIASANLVSETVTIATVPDKQAVRAGQIIATVKIIPFAVAADVMKTVLAALKEKAINLASYRSKRVALISTLSAGLKPSIIASTEEITRNRVETWGGEIIASTQTQHVTSDVVKDLRAALEMKPDIVMIAGASATVDRDDVVADYAATAENLRGEWSDAMTAVFEQRGIELTAGMVELITESPAEVLEALLERIDREHGSISAYLLAHGLTPTELERLTAVIIDPAATAV